MTNLKARIEEILKEVIDPYLATNLCSAKAIRNIAVHDNTVVIEVILGYPAVGFKDDLKTTIQSLLRQRLELESVEVLISSNIESHAVQQGLKGIKGVKNIIAIASGKGGVGKSTTAVNIALALAAEGATVGILDADIYGPSLPHMLGAQHHPETKDSKTLEPILAHGLQSMSIGYLITPDTPMVWRGPMVSSALQQLLNDTRWDNIDYLIIDLPPGTGDIQLTLAQKIPVSGAVIVTTPQDVALLDARKGIAMFQKVNVPVLGVIENMSVHICSNCGHQEHIFGEGGGASIAQQYGVKLLGSLPLDIRIRETADSGKPTVIAEPNGALAQAYRSTARHLAATLSLQTKNYAAKFPKIIIEDN